jgi:hypothetical protein
MLQHLHPVSSDCTVSISCAWLSELSLVGVGWREAAGAKNENCPSRQLSGGLNFLNSAKRFSSRTDMGRFPYLFHCAPDPSIVNPLVSPCLG